MGFTGYEAFLALGMLFTGSVNTLVTKLADVTDSTGIDGKSNDFDHPFFQALGMFLGEFLCLGVYYINKSRNKSVEKEEPQTWSPWIFALPAVCDMTGTSLMYLGLNLTYASVYQMLRGSVVIFTGIFTVVFLKKPLFRFQWLGMLLVLVGLLFVGLASVVGSGDDDNNAPDPVLGDIIIVCAQVIVAIQMVVEEKFLSKHDIPPLQVVGLEGMFGFTLTSFFLFLFYFIPGSSAGNHLENSPDALVQMGNSWIVMLSMFGTVVSIAFFNWFGVSVTKSMSATTRMVLDSCRTFIIWGVSLAIGWQSFSFWQVIGFVLLLSGTGVYNKIIIVPGCRPPEKTADLSRSLAEVNGDIDGNGASDRLLDSNIQ